MTEMLSLFWGFVRIKPVGLQVAHRLVNDATGKAYAALPDANGADSLFHSHPFDIVTLRLPNKVSSSFR